MGSFSHVFSVSEEICGSANLVIRFLAVLAAWTRALESINGKGFECMPWSKVKPPKAQPWVPLRSARIGFENPHWRNVSAPIIERVRPAQFMTKVVCGSIASAGIRYANSALGQERADGIAVSYTHLTLPTILLV